MERGSEIEGFELLTDHLRFSAHSWSLGPHTATDPVIHKQMDHVDLST